MNTVSLEDIGKDVKKVKQIYIKKEKLFIIKKRSQLSKKRKRK